jgi:hypothetical protein
MSENAGTGERLREPAPLVVGVELDTWVLPGDGLWQVAQPIALNNERPLAIEAALT